MSKVKLYSIKLKTPSDISLPSDFSGDINHPLLAQALHIYRDRLHPGNSKVQTRGEVSLTKAKWYRQKGTGRARHGAKSAPIFVGGGKAHGPKGVKRILSMPEKMRRGALLSALSLKSKEGKLAAVKDLSEIKKTKDAQDLVNMIREGESAKKITIVVAPKNAEFFKFAKNVKDANIERYSDLNAYKVYLSGNLLIDADAFGKKDK